MLAVLGIKFVLSFQNAATRAPWATKVVFFLDSSAYSAVLHWIGLYVCTTPIGFTVDKCQPMTNILSCNDSYFVLVSPSLAGHRLVLWQDHKTTVSCE